MAEHAAGPLFSILGLEINSITLTTWGIMLVLTLVSVRLTRKLSLVPTTRSQAALELGIGSLVGFMGTIMGSEEKARKYFPILGSFFIVILAGNYAGLLPGAGHLPGFQAPTSALSYTAALALTVFFITHAAGFRAKGFRYLKHFIEPYPAMLPLNLMEELIKPLSLSLRLYGNVYGEETLVASIFAIVPLFLPLPFMFLGVFFGFIQALVFTLLTATYLATATAGHE
ncbi:MAG: F0F1 ATP synthase subunit A [Oscillibacter sp.]